MAVRACGCARGLPGTRVGRRRRSLMQIMGSWHAIDRMRGWTDAHSCASQGSRPYRASVSPAACRNTRRVLPAATHFRRASRRATRAPTASCSGRASSRLARRPWSSRPRCSSRGTRSSWTSSPSSASRSAAPSGISRSGTGPGAPAGIAPLLPFRCRQRRGFRSAAR